MQSNILKKRLDTMISSLLDKLNRQFAHQLLKNPSTSSRGKKILECVPAALCGQTRWCIRCGQYWASRESRLLRGRLHDVLEGTDYWWDVIDQNLHDQPKAVLSVFFLTLTRDDCPTNRIRANRRQLLEDFNGMMKRPEFRFCVGSAGCVEVTPSATNPSSENVHLHVDILRYGGHGGKDWFSQRRNQKRLNDLWRAYPGARDAHMEPVRDLDAVGGYIPKHTEEALIAQLNHDIADPARAILTRNQLAGTRRIQRSGLFDVPMPAWVAAPWPVEPDLDDPEWIPNHLEWVSHPHYGGQLALKDPSPLDWVRNKSQWNRYLRRYPRAPGRIGVVDHSGLPFPNSRKWSPGGPRIGWDGGDDMGTTDCRLRRSHGHAR